MPAKTTGSRRKGKSSAGGSDIALVPTRYGLRGRAIQVYVALQRGGALSDYVPVNMSQIARDEGMSRNTVRVALARLAAKGLVRRDKNRRTWWRVFTSPVVDDVEEES